MKKKHTIEEMRCIADERGGVCLSEEYLGYQKKLEWKCEKGHIWEAKTENVINGSWCPTCARKNNGEALRKYKMEDAHEIAKKNKGVFLGDDFVSVKTKYNWKCEKGHVFESTFFSIKYMNTWCAYCSQKKKLTIEEMQKIAIQRGGLCISDVYVNLNTQLLWKCADGHEFEATPDNVKNNKSWCPYCKTFPTEQKCRYILEQLFKCKFKKTRKTLGRKYELDGYNEELKLAFEYHGRQHYEFVDLFYRTPKEFEDRLKIDAEKERLCKEKEIFLIVIPYWENKTDKNLISFIISEIEKLNIHINVSVSAIQFDNFREQQSKLIEIRGIAKSKGGELLSRTFNSVDRKVTLRCAEGHEWTTTNSSIKNGTWCAVCAGFGKGSIEQMQEKAVLKGGQCLSKQYINSFSKLTFVCEKKHEFLMEPARINQGKWCPRCARKSGASWKRLKIEQIKEIVESKSGILLSEKYENTVSKVKIKCEYGHIWETKPANIIYSNSWCPECYKLGKNKRKKR